MKFSFSNSVFMQKKGLQNPTFLSWDFCSPVKRFIKLPFKEDQLLSLATRYISSKSNFVPFSLVWIIRI